MNRIHRTLRRAALVFSTTIALVACLAFSAAAAQPGTVITDDARLREDSSISGKVLTKLDAGDTLEVLGSSNSDWLLVNYTDEDGDVISGYIHREDTIIGGEASTPLTNHAGVSQSATVLDGGAVLYSEASNNYQLTTLSAGQVVLIADDSLEGWLKVSCCTAEGNWTGYVAAQDVRPNAMAYGYTGQQPTPVYATTDLSLEPAAELDMDMTVAILDEVDGCYQITCSEVTGYVAQSLISVTHEEYNAVYGAGTELLYLRETAKARADVLTSIAEGSPFQITSDAVDGWYATRYNGQTGYVRAQDVAFVEDFAGGFVQVTIPALELKAGIGSTFATLTVIPTDEVLEVISAHGTWYMVSYAGCTGFVNSAYVCATDKDGWRTYPEYVKITASSLSVREAPDSDGIRLTKIRRNTVVEVEGMEDGWYVVCYNNKIGYIDPSYTVASRAPVVNNTKVGTQSDKYEGGTTVSGGSGSDVVAYAAQFLGNPYVWGGESLTRGADCSGFVMKVYEHFGVKLPHSSRAMRSCGKSVSYAEMQPGDIVCYDGHVGIYAGGGKIINALNAKKGIVYTDVNYDTILTIRRIFG